MLLLDRLFQRFDSLAEAHGVYKARLPCSSFFFNVFSSVVPPFQRLSPHDTPTPQVETIGDSYMAVTGALPFRSDHASAALRFALDLCVAASAVDYVSGDGTRSRLAVRVGLHTGPVTSGGAP